MGRDGSIYIAGTTNGNLDGQRYSGNSDAFVSKFSSDGEKQWTRLLGGSGSDSGTGITFGTDGSIYIAGSTNADIEGQNVTEDFIYRTITYGHIGDTYQSRRERLSSNFISKFSENGEQQWVNILGGTSNGIELSNLTWNNYFVSNNNYPNIFTKDSTSVFVSKSGVVPSLTTGTDGIIYLVGSKLEPNLWGHGRADALISGNSQNGARVLQKRLGVESRIDIGSAKTTGSDGSIYFAGTTNSWTFDSQPLTDDRHWSAPVGTYSDAFISKYGTNGWTRLLGSFQNDFAYSITTGPDNSVYILGTTTGDLHGQTNNGDNNGFISKFSPDGEIQWTRLLG